MLGVRLPHPEYHSGRHVARPSNDTENNVHSPNAAVQPGLLVLTFCPVWRRLTPTAAVREYVVKAAHLQIKERVFSPSHLYPATCNRAKYRLMCILYCPFYEQMAQLLCQNAMETVSPGSWQQQQFLGLTLNIFSGY